MLPTEDLFVYVYVLIDDADQGQGHRHPGAAPARRPAAPTRRSWRSPRCAWLLGRRSEAGFLAEVARDWAHLFPVLPHQSELNRRARWLWGAFEQFRGGAGGPPARRRLPADRHQRAAGQARLPGPRPRRLDRPQWPACPVRPRRRARRVVLRLPPGGQDRPGQPASCGPGASCPAAVSERDVGTDLLESRAAAPRPARGQGVQRQGVRRVPGRLRHRRAGPAHQGPAQDHARRSCRRSSPSGATASRPPLRRSPTRWSWPATARIPSGACSPGQPRPSPPIPSCGPVSPHHRSTHITRLRSHPARSFLTRTVHTCRQLSTPRRPEMRRILDLGNCGSAP